MRTTVVGGGRCTASTIHEKTSTQSELGNKQERRKKRVVPFKQTVEGKIAKGEGRGNGDISEPATISLH